MIEDLDSSRGLEPASSATAMISDQRARGIDAYRKSDAFRRRVDLILHRAVQEHGPIDRERPEEDAFNIAREALVMMLQAIYEDDGEIRNLKNERDHFRKLAEDVLSLAPPKGFILTPSTTSPV